MKFTASLVSGQNTLPALFQYRCNFYKSTILKYLSMDFLALKMFFEKENVFCISMHLIFRLLPGQEPTPKTHKKNGFISVLSEERFGVFIKLMDHWIPASRTNKLYTDNITTLCLHSWDIFSYCLYMGAVAAALGKAIKCYANINALTK